MSVTFPRINAMSVTPFDQAGTLDLDALSRHVDRLAASGIGVYLGSFGSGEGHLLDETERVRLYRAGVDAAAGRVPVVAAALGFADTDRVIAETLTARDAGVDAVQVFGPSPGPTAIRPTEEEIEAYLHEVLDALDLPVVLSNEAVMVGYTISPELLARVCESHEVVVALNTADANPLQTLALTEHLSHVLPVYVGFFSQILPAWTVGAAGAVCYEANVAPKLCARLGELLAGSDPAHLPDVYGRLVRLHRALMIGQTPRSVKAAMGMRGADVGPVRRPYLPLTPLQQGHLDAALRSLDLESP